MAKQLEFADNYARARGNAQNILVFGNHKKGDKMLDYANN